MLAPIVLKYFVKEASLDYAEASKRPDPLRVRHAPDKRLSGLKKYRFSPKEYIAELDRRYGNDPVYKDIAAERKSLLQSQITNTPSLNRLDMAGTSDGYRYSDPGSHFDIENQRAITRDSNPLTLGHEVGHAEDLHKRVGTSGKTSLTLNERENLGLRKTRGLSNGDLTFPYKNQYANNEVLTRSTLSIPDHLQDAKAARETLVREREATKNALEHYRPWLERHSKKMSPAERKNVADILASQTSYWDRHNSGARKSRFSSRNQERGLRIKELTGSKNPAVAERATKLLESFSESGNPFKQKGKWSNMSKSERTAYIQHIKDYSRRVEDTFGSDAAKLYRSELMSKLRGML